MDSSTCLNSIGQALLKTKNVIKRKLSPNFSENQDSFYNLEISTNSQLEHSAIEGKELKNEELNSTQTEDKSTVSYNGQIYNLSSNKSSIDLTPLSSPPSSARLHFPSPFLPKNTSKISIPLKEVLNVEFRPFVNRVFCGNQTNQIVVNAIKRLERGNFLGEWDLQEISFENVDEQFGNQFEFEVNNIIRQNFSERPRKLLVFINPYGGSRRAKKIYFNSILPIFDMCSIQTEIIETKYRDHAQDVLQQIDFDKLVQFDGMVGVGGDGLFQEILNGLFLRKDHEKIVTEKRIRLAQIPGGSTDCLAYSVNGSRSPIVSALHIVLGDRIPLDVMRIRNSNTQQNQVLTKHAVCLAAYGFLGDVMRRSELLRFLGQKRYDVAGFFTYLANQSYQVRIDYLPYQESHHGRIKSRCHSQCSLCCSSQKHVLPKLEDVNGISEPQHESEQKQHHEKSFSQNGGEIEFSSQSSIELLGNLNSNSNLNHSTSKTNSNKVQDNISCSANSDGDWQTIEGDYKMVMCAVTCCISERSRFGLVPFAHTSDGRMHLILVPKINHGLFLWFLSSMGRHGIDEEQFKFIQSIDVRAFKITPSGRESSWSVDGELMTHNQVEGEIMKGLIDVFARGVEVKSPKEKRV